MPSKFLWETAAEHDLVVCRDRCWQRLFDRCCARKSSFGTKVPSEYDPTGKGLGQIALENGTARHNIASHHLLLKCHELFRNISLTLAPPD